MAASRLVFIHGRAQEHKDSIKLKKEWVDVLAVTLRKRGLDIPIAETEIKFPYYGQALFDMVSGKPKDQVAEIVVRGPAASQEERDFMLAVLDEVRKVKGISDEEIDSISQAAVTERGILNWEIVQRILIAIDRNMPGGSEAAIALATKDVYEYLFNPAISASIDEGVEKAMVPDVPTVVVSHSLGTVVAYKMLRDRGMTLGWKVPLFITLGSPLAVTAIKTKLRPNKHPECVSKWYNAMDERDVVSLYPLNDAHFRINPSIENKTNVNNHTENRHGISGYMDDSDVSDRIYQALK
jgi:hypothetical protein